MIRLDRLFTQHPATVGETYFAHLRQAFSFSYRAGLTCAVCLVHGALPFLFTKTGSRLIERLYRDMLIQRGAARPPSQTPPTAPQT